MKSRKSLILIGLVFVLLLGGAYILYDRLGQSYAPDQLATQTQPDTEAATGTAAEATQQTTAAAQLAAPDFTVYDQDGNEVHLSDYFGKPIILNFWASWCGPCKMEMPDFHEKYLTLGDEIHFLMVNMTTGRETRESADAFIAQQGYTFPVFYDMDADAAYTYGAYSLPTTYFISAEGYVVARATGAISADTLQQGIDMIA